MDPTHFLARFAAAIDTLVTVILLLVAIIAPPDSQQPTVGPMRYSEYSNLDENESVPYTLRNNKWGFLRLVILFAFTLPAVITAAVAFSYNTDGVNAQAGLGWWL